ncbi:AraC family transcriptional regulator [Futiania mangrovi]|uniref:AraC family transcriptional regulator n=1 Tax=Futiania mangrovi TaxID=2959716 RepID=A0A9J6PEE3_9PROT|nr:AraC family transcriptional regulator [Futiania mangrovii]MCP1337789.1 AraC family transcriptional regulator [Futiania mangrovii]
MAQPHGRASVSSAGSSGKRAPLPIAAPAAKARPPPGAAVPASDPLSDVLRSIRLTGALFFLVEARQNWGVEVPQAREFAAQILPRARDVISYHVILEGGGWACVSGQTPVRFRAGDVLVMAHGDAYSLLAEPDRTPEFSGSETVRFLGQMAAGKLPFVVEEGTGPTITTRFICGYLGCDRVPFNPLLGALPALLHVRADAVEDEGPLPRLIELALAEFQVRRPGGDALRLTLSELMFLEVLRLTAAQPSPDEKGWLRALQDPVLSRALSLLHTRPAHAWRLAALAAQCGVSRTALAERFSRRLGCAPMRYLSLWRMQIASRLLIKTGSKIAAIAEEVGYASESAFSRAFKGATGQSPGAWRAGSATRSPEDGGIKP